jgi:fibro-slime domain-containing protein
VNKTFVLSCVSVLSLMASGLAFGACGGGGGGDPTDVDASGGGDDGTEVDAEWFPGLPDARPVVCGDGFVDGAEVCDDGDAVGGDGCAADCAAVEAGWACGDPGDDCVRTQVCGNAILETGETCDDNNTDDGDGCSATCALVDGWSCPVPGIRCTAASCGDGLIAGFEQCDDGTPGGGDGCSDTCALETGWACTTAGSPCHATVCGDGVPEAFPTGTEECDDGNHDLGDGCDTQCHREPVCVDGVCTATCGDGVIQTGEPCDDGNLFSGDGCSATCAVEPGFACAAVSDAEPSTLRIPVVYRDFRGHDLTGGHADFENSNGGETGIVKLALGADHKPQYNGNPNTATTHGAAGFAQWYTDSAMSMTYAEELVLTRTAAGTYVYDNAAFFPLDGRGWVGAGMEPARNSGHNFSFTSEVRYWFQYAGDEVLSFRGDDDVWVFINGRRALDLGGVHSAQSASITLDAGVATTFNLTIGGTYEVVVFQAERHTTQSSYKLTLKGFNAAYSQCDDTCGDAITSSNEACDDGVNMGGYGSCTADCLGYGPRCGDGEVQPAHEACDDGVNAGGYGNCEPTCQYGPRCGDGVIQSAQGETCDDQNDDADDGCHQCHLIVD